MIAYLDSSALVKLYVEEPGRPAVRRLVAAVTAVSTSTVAYPEVRAALARRARDGSLTEAGHIAVKRQLDLDWGHFVSMEPTHVITRLAGDLSEQHALRGFDAVHLACAVTLREHLGPLGFASWDLRLAVAARAEGFAVTGPGVDRA